MTSGSSSTGKTEAGDSLLSNQGNALVAEIALVTAAHGDQTSGERVVATTAKALLALGLFVCLHMRT